MVGALTEGMIFYWISWIFWVIITFLLNKNKQRTSLAVWILFIIFCSNWYIHIEIYHLSVAFICIYMGGFVLLARMAKSVYYLFASFTVMIGYTSFLLWEQLAPVWLLISRDIMFPLLMTSMVLLISRGFWARISISLIGICTGELLYSHILLNFNIHKTIGGMAFLDMLCTILFVLFVLEVLVLCRKIVASRIRLVKHRLPHIQEGAKTDFPNVPNLHFFRKQ